MDTVNEVNGMPNGIGGGRDPSHTGIHGGMVPQAPIWNENPTPPRALGESTGEERGVYLILPEGGEFTRDEMDSARWYISMLSRRRSELVERARREDIGSEGWWDVTDEITACCDSIEAIRRSFRRN